MGVGVSDAPSTIHLIPKSKLSSMVIMRGSVKVVLEWSQPQHLPPRWCFKRQLVDLVKEGVWQELLDSAQIEIYIADW